MATAFIVLFVLYSAIVTLFWPAVFLFVVAASIYLVIDAYREAMRR